MPLFFAVATFIIIVALGVLAGFAAGRHDRQELIRRRLEAIHKAQKRGRDSLELQLIRDELLSGVQPLNRLMLRWSWATALRNFMIQAGMQTRPGKIILISAILALASYIAARHFLHSVLLGIGVGLVCSLIPLGVIAVRRYMRLRAFEKGLPDAIDLLGRAVRAGHAFTTGLEMIGKELSEPVASEFRVTFEEQKFGLPLKDAFLNMTERVPLVDVRFFVTALLIQKETGGNLAEILDGLSRVIRERFKILGEVRVRTAQGRLTAAILIALPPIMIVMMSMLNPGYIKPLFTDPWGPLMLAGAAGLQIVGTALLWKIVNIEV